MSAGDRAALAERAEMLINRVRKNARHLRKWARREGVTCYRLYDRDIPELPLAIDWYEGRLHVAEYARTSTERFGEDWVEIVSHRLAEALGVDAGAVYIKTRQRQKGSAQYQVQARSGERFEVTEGGHRFWANLADYLDTGLFLDHRITRAKVQGEAAGARFLNLFCYTGAFTVYAAAGGSLSSVSVDLSNTYLDWARDNLRLNQIDQSAHQLLRADVMELLSAPPADLGPFDLVVLDPPTFSNSKAMREVLDIQRDHVRLIEQTLSLMVPGGVLYFSTNRRRFQLDETAIEAAVTDITGQTIPPDFRNDKIHRAYRIVKA